MAWTDDHCSTGPALRRFRRASGLSQEAVAAALGVHQSMVSKWEGGRERPNFGNERAIWRLIGERPVSERVDGLVEAVTAMPLSAGVFDNGGRAVAESAQRRAWTGGVPLRDLMTEQDRANVAAFGGVDEVLSRPGLAYSYHRRRVHTGEHTLLSAQNLKFGDVVLHLITISPLPSTAVRPCGRCDGFGRPARGKAVACPDCGGFGYRFADQPVGA